MGNKIKAGEYIRTKAGEIGVIGFPDEEENMFEQKQFEWYSNGKSYNLIKEYEVIKHSKNIVDLIEEGDYVNGIKIYSVKKGIGYGDKGQEGIIINKIYCNCKFIPTENIKSIVTKEQFKIVEYEV